VIACAGACIWTINLTKELQKRGRKKDAATVTADGDEEDITVLSNHDDEDAKFSMDKADLHINK
jgi:hypothetical protein